MTDLAEARDAVMRGRDKGVRCPCCGQFAKVYKRKLNSGMARSLIAMYLSGGMEWLHLPTSISARSREEGKLRYWDLVEESPDVRADGGRAGWWRVTELGYRFVMNEATVQARVLLYDGVLLGFEGSQVSIKECLGQRFNYHELMGL